MSRLQPISSATDPLRQVDEFFMESSPVHKTLREVVRRLSEEQIDYAIIGGMALALHGFIRPTEDVDLLLTREGLEKFHQNSLDAVTFRSFPELASIFVIPRQA